MVVDSDGNFQLGPFGIRLIPLAHSILEMSAVVIDTPYGRVFHTGDWKLDEEPLLGVPATAAALRSEERSVGKEGVSTVRVGWSPDHYKKNITTNTQSISYNRSTP